MRKTVLFFVFLILASTIAFLIFRSYSQKTEKEFSIVSPVPNFLTITDNKQVSTLSIWLPTLISYISGGRNEAPEITAKSAIIYDTTTNKVLYKKSPTERLPMASLTKIMTAIISLENPKKSNDYEVSGNDLVGEDSMGLESGEVLQLNDLLYGLMLHSANDAAEALASNYVSGRVGFIKAMNDKAKALGLKDTNFTNPSGLEGDGRQYTTVYDLLVMTEYAISNFSDFDKIVSTFDYSIPQTDTHKEYDLENETNLLTSYPGVKGVKTGYTPEAGLCLVTYLDYKGHKIIGVILGSDDRRGEMIELLDYSLKSEGITPPPHG